MIQPPQVTSNSGTTPLPQPGGKVLQKQTGNDESFASLLEGNGGSATAASPDSAPSAGGAAQTATVRLRGPSPSDGKQATLAAGGAAGEASNTCDAVQAQSPKDEQAPFLASDAFYSRSFLASGNPATAPVRRNSQAAAEAVSSSESANAKSAKDSGSGNSKDATTAALPANAGASDSLAVLAAQIQISQVPNAATEQAQGGTALSAGSSAGGGHATGRSASRASAPAALADAGSSGVTGGAEAQAAAAQAGLAAGLVQGSPKQQASAQGMPNPSAGGQGQAGELGGTALAGAKGTSPLPGAEPSKLMAGSMAPGFTVTDVRTHFAPESQSTKAQARDSAVPNTEAALQAGAGAVEAASSAGQGTPPATVTESAGSRSGRSGGETPAPAPGCQWRNLQRPAPRRQRPFPARPRRLQLSKSSMRSNPRCHRPPILAKRQPQPIHPPHPITSR